jgi:glycosyltransferase involved in cell wall biosynthesis
MEESAKKEEHRNQLTGGDAYARLSGRLAEQMAQLRLCELERERLSTDLKAQQRRFVQLSRSPFFRLFNKLQALDTRDISGRAFRFARKVKRLQARLTRKALLRKTRLEYTPIFVARGAPIQGRSSFTELIPASDSPQKVVPLDSVTAKYTFSFMCGFEGLSHIGFAFDTSKLKSNPTVKLRVELDELTCHEAVCAAKDLTTEGLHSFSFGPILPSAGKNCTVTVSSPDGKADDYIGVILFGEHPSRVPSLSANTEVALNQEASQSSFNPCFLAEARGAHETRSIGWVASKAPTQFVPLYGDRVVSFTFETPKWPITAISVIFNTFDRYSFTDINVEVRSCTIRVWRCSFSTEQLNDQEPFELPIPQSVLHALRNNRVVVSLSCPTAATDQFMFILGTPCFSLEGTEASSFKSGVNHAQIARSPIDGSAGAPVFREVFRSPPWRLRIAILEGQRARRDALRAELLKIFSKLVDLGHDVILYPQDKLESLVGSLRDSDIVIVPDQDYSEALREVVTEVRMSYGIVIGLSVSGFTPSKLLEACSAVCSPSAVFDESKDWLTDVVVAHRESCDPSVSIVTVLYKKEREIPLFLQCLARQDFNGNSELVVVNDCSPDRSKETLIRCYEELKQQGYSLPNLTIIDNEKNSGNCSSRNRALQVVTGDVVVIVDADCLLNDNFLSAHVHSHIFHDASVVIGPCNLESGLADPIAKLKEYERDPERVQREAELQDPINLNSFVNCITRNFSIRRTAISEALFDEVFGYSASPESGFGWEDVEMGYGLYKRRLKIHFTSQAISVHVTHPSSTEDKMKPLKSLKNFRRLIEKHPTIATDARRWFQDTFSKIEQWSAACGHSVQEDQRIIREKLGQLYPYPFAIVKNRELRIVTYRWHVPHQYELYKLPHRFTLLRGLGTGFTSDWMYEQRPMPKSARFLPVERFKVNDADVAILHFDENVLQPENCNGVISKDWGHNFRYFMEQMKGIPKVAVCHGTPQFIGKYNPGYNGADLGKPIESSREELVRYLADVPVVCNSHQALREWGFKNARVIWHGFDPSEFQTSTYEGGILTLGAAMKERPYYRGYGHYQKVCEMLPAEFSPDFHSVGRPALGITNSHRYAQLKFDEYRRSIRRYSVYFNPTLRSPMPRSRGEAMMSGLVTVSAANHDVDLFIKNGWNGFYAQSSEEMAEHLLFLMRNKRACREMGVRSRETAADVFNHDRYLYAWQNLLTELI